MTNVIPLRPVRPTPGGAAPDGAPDPASLPGLLSGMIERIEIAGAQVALLDRPALQIERTIQALLDAATALEQAAGALRDGERR